MGCDSHPTRNDVIRIDACKVPRADRNTDLGFLDLPCSTHLDYPGPPAE